MTLRVVSRLVLGFVAGICTGAAAGLLRTPRAAPPRSSAADAIALPQEDFGRSHAVPDAYSLSQPEAR